MTDKIKIELVSIDPTAKRVSHQYHKVSAIPLESMIPNLLERVTKGYKIMSLKLTSDVSLLN